MKKSTVRIITISIGMLLFIILMGGEIVNQYSLWQEWGSLKYTSFFDMVFSRCKGAIFISLLISLFPVFAGEIVLYIKNKGG